MGKIQKILDKNSVEVYPVTHERAVRDSNGVSLESKLGQFTLDYSRVTGYYNFSTDETRAYYNTSGTPIYNTNRAKTFPIPVSEGDRFEYALLSGESMSMIAAFNNGEFVQSASVPGTDTLASGEYIVPSGVTHIVSCTYPTELYRSYLLVTGSVISRINGLEDTTEKIGTQLRMFSNENDGRLIEFYSNILDSDKKYYFKFFRKYENASGCQIRLYEYTNDDKSDEVLVAGEAEPLSANVIKMFISGGTPSQVAYVVYDFNVEDAEENLPMELNVENCSSTALCPTIKQYVDNPLGKANDLSNKLYELVASDKATLNKRLDGETLEELNDDKYLISPFIEVEPIEGDYYVQWNYGFISVSPEVFLVVYNSNKEPLYSFGNLSSGKYRNVRISFVQGYKYYRISIPYERLFETFVFDTVENKYTLRYDYIATLSLLARESSGSDSDDFDDMVVMPSKTYLLRGVENSMYHANYMKYISDRFFLAPAQSFLSNGWKFLDRCVRVSDSNVTDFNARIVTKNNLEVKKNFTIHGVFGEPSRNPSAKNVNCIGDSFTYNGAWFQQVYDITSGLSFVGMRRSYNTGELLRAEGRGGWTLAEYFLPYDDVTPTHMQPFSPFLHPAGYTYYGVIDFWKVVVNNNSQYAYGTNGFDDYASWFDTNGYKKNPSNNDLMYDGANNKFVYFDGSSWVDYPGTPSFVFDYAKYVSTWNIASPDFVIIMLGKNDFQSSADDTVFTEWAGKMDTFIDGIRAYGVQAGKDIIIGICTPAVANDTPNNSDNNSPYIGGRNMWEARKKIISRYDNATYQNNGVYVIDSGICLDPLYGFPMQEMKPFDFYDGDVRELISTNGVHPSTPGYKQMGTCVAGFIQSKR